MNPCLSQLIQRYQSSQHSDFKFINYLIWITWYDAGMKEMLKMCKEKRTFIVSRFISVQIPSNVLCTYDIYIKNTKLYIHNRFFLFLLWCLKIKMLFMKKKKDEFWYCWVLQYINPFWAPKRAWSTLAKKKRNKKNTNVNGT